jgi:hypothetical protein
MLQLYAAERVKHHLSVSGRLLLPPISNIDEDANQITSILLNPALCFLIPMAK